LCDSQCYTRVENARGNMPALHSSYKQDFD
jgi:hypothetical protein